MSQHTTSLSVVGVGVPVERNYSTRQNDFSRNPSMRKVTFQVQSPQENMRLEGVMRNRRLEGMMRNMRLGGASRKRMLDLSLVAAVVFTVWVMYFIPIITLSLPLIKVSAHVYMCVCV